jgi:N-acetylmuramoyl-L-alanine amidase
VTAFQRHFRPERVDGVSDASTRATLADLLAHRDRPRSVAARVINFDRLVVTS